MKSIRRASLSIARIARSVSEGAFERTLFFPRLRFGLVSVCCLVFVGCGGDGRLPLIGEVKVDGEVVADGYVEFRPLSGTASPTAGSPIVDGSYKINADKGVLPGKFRVEIRAMRTVEKPVLDHMTGKPRQGYEQFLPDRFNHESELAVDVDNDRTRHDFDLSLRR